MNRKRILNSICLTVLSLSASAAQAQRINGPASYTTPATTVVRDSDAVSLLRQSINAMRKDPKASLDDFTLQGEVVLWGGHPSHGSIKQLGVRTADLYTGIDIDGKPAVRFAKSAEGAISQRPNEQPSPIQPRLAAQAARYCPIPLIQEALENPFDSIQSVPGRGGPDAHVLRVKLVVQPEHWNSQRPSRDAVAYEVSIDPDTHVIVRIFNMARFDGRSDHFIPHNLIFSDYRAEHGWFVPHHIDEAYDGMLRTTVVLSSFTVNAGLQPSAFSIE